MKQVKLSEFRKVAREYKSSFNKDDLKSGETGWISGFPDQSADGTVSVRSENGITITISEKDVIEIIEYERKYYLRVSPGIHILTKWESINQLRPLPSRSPCNCGSDEDKVVEKVSRPDFGGFKSPLSISLGDPCIQCHIVWEEQWCELQTGERFKCYVPKQVCENVCIPA